MKIDFFIDNCVNKYYINDTVVNKVMVIKMPRTRLRPEIRKAQILESAKKQLELNGYQKLTVPGIVKSAGISQGSFYRYFKNVDDIVITLIKNEVFPAMLAASDHLDFGPIKNALELENVLYNWFETLGQQIARNSILIREMLTVILHSKGAAAAEINRFIDGIRKLCVQVMEQSNGIPPFRKLNAKIISYAVVGMVIGASIQAAKEGLDVKSWAREIARLECSGLLVLSREAEEKR